MNYALSQKEYSNLKRRLTGALNKLKKATIKGPTPEVAASADAVIKEVAHANSIFAAKGFPDEWSRWERAEEDANTAKRLLRRHAGGGL
jgi:hypothetical protein